MICHPLIIAPISAQRQALLTERLLSKLFRPYRAFYVRLIAVAFQHQVRDALVREYLPKWRAHPLDSFARYGIAPTTENLEKQLRSVITKLVEKAVTFDAPRVRLVYKNIAPEFSS